MSVTVIASLYGDKYDSFVPAWFSALTDLNQSPHEIIVATDRERDLPGVRVVVSDCHWRYPQAWHQNQAAALVSTEWLWIVDVDNSPFPDALDGLEDVDADVWLMGYLRSSDGLNYTPPQLTAGEYLALDGNPFPAGSAIRTEAFHAAGGYRDIAFEDWGLWRALALNDATFEASDRANYHYFRHPGARSETEMRPDNRAEHMAEMLEGEPVAA